MTDPRTGSRWILGDKFDQVYPHLGSIDNLWLKKWKFPCERSLYPFHDGKPEVSCSYRFARFPYIDSI
jgi:hypothetical protein